MTNRTKSKGHGVLLYTTGKKPFVQNFYEVHKEQAKRVGLRFMCISMELWNENNQDVELQLPRQSSIPYTGIMEAILQGLSHFSDDDVVFIAEDDCLYQDSRFIEEFIDIALQEPDCMFYQKNVSFISSAGFFLPKVNGLCLHSAYGTAAAISHNIKHKLAEFNDETDFPGSSVEPVSYPTLENPDPANSIYRTRSINTDFSLSLDFRGYGGQTWEPDGNEEIYSHDDVWGDADVLWRVLIEEISHL